MGSKSYSIGRVGPKRISAKWSFNFGKTTIFVEGQPVMEIIGKRNLKQGAGLPLTCGEYLEAQYVRNSFVGAGLQLRLGGIPVAGSVLSSKKRMTTLGRYFLFFALIQLPVGLGLLSGGDDGFDTYFGALFFSMGVINIAAAFGSFSGKRGLALTGAIAFSVFLAGVFGGGLLPIVFCVSIWMTLPSRRDFDAEAFNGERFWSVDLQAAGPPIAIGYLPQVAGPIMSPVASTSVPPAVSSPAPYPQGNRPL